MSRLPIIIGGTPGSGKTTLSANLADSYTNGVHLQTDYFFHFLSHCIDPSTPESHTQNQAVTEAYCNAANTYRQHGYQVIIDGVIGPWHFEALTQLMGSFHYILLHAPLATTLQRVAQRNNQPSAHPSVIERMQPQFERVLEAFESHVILTTNLSIADLIPQALAKVDSQLAIITGG
ncbi:MAG: AAA family ATPase [Pseudomonadota bacterium]